MRRILCLALSLCLLVLTMPMLPVTVSAAEENLVFKGAVIHGGEYQTSYGQPEDAINGILDLGWWSTSGVQSQYIVIKLAKVSKVSRIVAWLCAGSSSPNTYNVFEYSLNGVDWSSESRVLSGMSPITEEDIYYGPDGIGQTVETGYKRTCTFEGGTVTAQYIKIGNTRTTRMQIREIEIFGEELNTCLSELTLSEGELIPEFDKNIDSYDVMVDSSYELPEVYAEPEDENASVVITQATPQTMKAVVEITSAGGEYTRVYTVNMISVSENADLKSLELSYGELTPQFKRDVTEYSVVVEEGEKLPDIIATSASMAANVVITPAALPELKTVVRVTSADGNAIKEYIISFILTGAQLSSLSVGEYELMPEFSSETKLYNVNIGTHDPLPEVSAKAKHANAHIIITQATAQTMYAKVVITSLLGQTQCFIVFFTRVGDGADENLALQANGGMASSSSGGVPGLGIDGDKSTLWSASTSGQSFFPWYCVELGDISLISRVTIFQTYGNSPAYFRDIKYSVSGREDDWHDLPHTYKTDFTATTQSALGYTTGGIVMYNLTEPVVAKFIKVTLDRVGNMKVREIEIYGSRLNPYLSELTLSSGELIPEFDKYTDYYEVMVPSSADLPDVDGKTEDENAQIHITQADAQTMKATVDVTTRNREYTHRYTIDMISTAENAELRDLTLSEGSLVPAFRRNITEYEVAVTTIDDLPDIIATPMVETADVQIISATPQSLKTIVRVTSSDGGSVKEYTVSFVLTGTELASLSAGAKELIPAFDPDIESYAIILDEHEEIPEVKAVPLYSAEVEIAQASDEKMRAEILITSLLGETRTYTILFSRKENSLDNSQLAFMFPSSGGLEGGISPIFDPDQKEYMVYLENQSAVPTITAIAQSSAATVEIVQADAKTMTAFVTVTSGNGENISVYTVYFLINVALGRTGYHSSAYSGGKAYKAFDGNFDTGWHASARGAPQWVVCNLEGSAKIFGIKLYQDMSLNNNYFNVIRASNDGRIWTDIPVTVTTTALPEKIGISTFVVNYTFSPFEARYVMVSGRASVRSRAQEIQLFGIREPIVSANSYLKSMQTSHGKLTPNFSAYIMNYTIRLEKDEPLPLITAEAADEFAVVNIEQATTDTMQATVTVTAENNISKTIYTVIMDREIEQEKDARLSSLSISSGKLKPDFSPAIAQYTVYLTPGEPIPAIKAVPHVQGARASITQSDTSLRVTVTSLDGSTQRIYTITFKYANAKLSSLTAGDAALLPEFDPDTIAYNVFLPPGTDLPHVSAVAFDEYAHVDIAQATKSNMTATVTVKAQDGDVIKTYTITFSYMQSLTEALASALAALRNYDVSNLTSADDIMNIVKNVVTNPNISTTWKTAFGKINATTANTGLITGLISLSLDDESIDLEVRKTIPRLYSSDPIGGGGSGGGSYNAAILPYTASESGNNEDTNLSDNGDDIESSIQGHWAKTEVALLLDKGIVKGNGASLALEDNVTRAEFIAMLIRATDIELKPYRGAFEDVSVVDWYAEYTQTAFDYGLVEGYEGKVGPNDYITREQAAKILMSFYELMYGEQDIQEEISFVDKENLSEWARDSVYKAAGLGLIKGFDTNEFRPLGLLTRAQAMVMTYRLCRF